MKITISTIAFHVVSWFLQEKTDHLSFKEKTPGHLTLNFCCLIYNLLDTSSTGSYWLGCVQLIVYWLLWISVICSITDEILK